jgi:hypothetical protein
MISIRDIVVKLEFSQCRYANMNVVLNSATDSLRSLQNQNFLSSLCLLHYACTLHTFHLTVRV